MNLKDSMETVANAGMAHAEIRRTAHFHAPVDVYRTAPDVQLPEYGSEDAACFDLRAYLPVGSKVKFFSKYNQKLVWEVREQEPYFLLKPGERALIPTGLIFDIPTEAYMRIYVRSSVGLKSGVNLPNQTGIIDPDYTDPTFITLINHSDIDFEVRNGDRLAQGEVVPRVWTRFTEIDTPPGQKGNRTGGFGSTGKN